MSVLAAGRDAERVHRQSRAPNASVRGVRGALVERTKEKGHLRGRQRVRKADEGRTGVAIGGQSLVHHDRRVGSPNANGSEPDGTTVPAATQESLVDEPRTVATVV